jgi:regulator of RNase E activity RraA
MTNPLASRLARLDACAVSDAMDQLKLQSAVTGITPRTVRKRISGPVVTVRLAPGLPPADVKPRHLCTTAIEAAEAGGVVVVEQRTGLDCAGWGGILSNAAQSRGLSGAIIDGPARDIDEAADLGFAVFARSTTARTARGRVYEVETGGPITVGDVTVKPGDWVVADSSGVVFLPAADVERIIEAAEYIAKREALMTKDVLAGEPVSQVMGASYEHMLGHK